MRKVWSGMQEARSWLGLWVVDGTSICNRAQIQAASRSQHVVPRMNLSVLADGNRIKLHFGDTLAIRCAFDSLMPPNQPVYTSTLPAAVVRDRSRGKLRAIAAAATCIVDFAVTRASVAGHTAIPANIRSNISSCSCSTSTTNVCAAAFRD